MTSTTDNDLPNSFDVRWTCVADHFHGLEIENGDEPSESGMCGSHIGNAILQLAGEEAGIKEVGVKLVNRVERLFVDGSIYLPRRLGYSHSQARQLLPLHL